MRWKKFILLCAWLFVSGLSAQETTVFHIDSSNYLQKHAVAMQFGLSDDFHLKPFSKVFFEGKYHFSDKIALRAIFGIRSQISEESRDEISGDITESERETVYDQINMGIKLPVAFLSKA